MKLSIIIPAYNAAGLMNRCLSSIEPGPGVEVIVVDDGSTDGTAGVVSSLAATRTGLRLIRQPNGGVSRARNAGLEEARGEFITFVDADDGLFPDALSRWMETLESVDASDILMMRSFCGGVERYPWQGCFQTETLYTKDDFMRLGFLRGSVCGCIYRTSFLREKGLQFPTDVPVAEDTVFWAASLAHEATASFADIPFYSITERPDSASRNYDDGFISRYGKALAATRQFIPDRPVADYTCLGILMGIVSAAVKMGWSPLRTFVESGIGSLLPLTTDGIFHKRLQIRILNLSFPLFFRLKQLRDYLR